MSALSAEASWPATLCTSRLLLRPAEAGDVHAFTRLWTDPEVRRFLGGPVAEQQLALYQQHFAGRPYVFSVTTRDEAVVVGSVSVEADSRFDGRREVSYAFLPEYWGRGYGCEAVAVVVGWALEAIPSHDPSAVAVTQEANVRSRRLLESIGMQPVDSFVEFDAPQVMYSAGPQWSAPAGESSPAGADEGEGTAGGGPAGR
ncbi:GNAT family N-acetyltransferase [Streptomyces sp. MCA2]|uniref:GNAT family N-acetyltransferase n=1 Tax=Streptomyces TaxID=1883 RepID=UPI002021598D|nr:GNAT family N-acetyltransferase [Streptomyces sp. MCA2]MCL7489965.1 GNAT family N-acetyltransferase [Streptomyces sp. MCA2]